MAVAVARLQETVTGLGKSDKLADLISCNAAINIQTVAATAATLHAE